MKFMDTNNLIPALGAKPITVKDIARLSRTSPSTVSRVLTGVAPVAKDKRDAVLKAIESVNYRPNLLARSLKTKSTRGIGLIINDILNPFYGAIARGVEERASEDGFTVVYCNTNEDSERELSYITILRDKAIDGIILAPTGANQDELESLFNLGTAVVQIDRRMPTFAASSVTVDNLLGGFLAAEHLLEAGHRHLGFLTYDTGQQTVKQRQQGCENCVQASNTGARLTSYELRFDLGDSADVVSALLDTDDRPTALIAANNRIATALLRTLKSRNIPLSRNLALVVFDDIEIFELMNPSITAISQPAYEIGYRAADLLIAQLILNDETPVIHEIFEPQLMIRQSSSFT
jgi:DNA-binding LacI/PurR family transcriptional regulator